MSEVALKSRAKEVKRAHDGVQKPFTPPDAAFSEVVGALKSFQEQNAGVSFKVKRTIEGHPFVKFGDYNQAFGATLFLSNYDLWKRFNIGIMHKGKRVWFMYLPYDGSYDNPAANLATLKPERPLIDVFWFFNGDEPVDGIRTVEFDDFRNTITFASRDQAKAAAELVKGRMGVTSAVVRGAVVTFSFQG